MATKAQLISDIELRLQRGKPSDDFELEKSQIAFWLSLAAAESVKVYLDSKLSNNESVDEYFIKRETCKPLNTETDPCVDEDAERIYIKLKKEPINLLNDRAIIRLRTSEGSVINKAKLNTIDFVEDMEFSAPSVYNLVYYRDDKTKLVIEGIPMSLKDVIEIIVWYIPKFNLLELSDDDDINISDELLNTILDTAEEKARRQMFGLADVQNDGEDDAKPAPVD